jgi:hypothetical protein
VFGNGGAAIVEPSSGQVIAGPLYGEEGIVFADCDLGACLAAKRSFDAVGHYSREDVFARTPAVPGAERRNGEQTPPGEAAATHDAP